MFARINPNIFMQNNPLNFIPQQNCFIFELSHETLRDLDKKIEDYLKIQHNFLLLKKDFPDKILSDLSFLKENQKILKEKEEGINSLQAENEEMKLKIFNQKTLVDSIESAYIEKINDLKEDMKELKEKLELEGKTNEENFQKFEIKKIELLTMLENERKV